MGRTSSDPDTLKSPDLVEESEAFAPAEKGSQIGSGYIIEELLGQGGMGAVYKARHSILDRVVAIKVMLSNDSRTGLLRFQREAKAVSKLNHPNIVNVTEFGQSGDNQVYMVMDYISGSSLSSSIRTRNRFPLEETIDIAIQIADGIGHAHENGILHRDLKPSNIMLAQTDPGKVLVKIVDFGIAKLTDDQSMGGEKSLTQTGHMIGSPLYMSPEQALGRECDHRSDIYSIGCIIYETLTGVVPLEGENYVATLFKQINEKPTSLKEATLGETFPESVEAIVAKCLEKDPGNRYQSAADLQNELLQLKGTRLNQEMKSLAAGKQQSSWKKEPLLVTLAILGVVAAIALAPYLINRDQVDHREQPRVGISGNTNVEPDASKNVESATHSTKNDKLNPDSKGANQSQSKTIQPTNSMPDLGDPSLLLGESNDHGRVSLEGTKFGDSEVNLLENPASISSLNLTKTLVTDFGLTKLARFNPPLKNLQQLRLNATKIEGKEFSELERFPKLHELELNDLNFYSPEVLNDLRGTKLTSLSLRGDSLRNEDLRFLRDQKDLKTLILRDNGHLNDDCVKHLLALKNLEILDLSNTRMSDAGVKQLSQLSSLRKLALRLTAVRGTTFSSLARMPSLTRLNISGNFVPIDYLKVLSESKTLTWISLGGGFEKNTRLPITTADMPFLLGRFSKLKPVWNAEGL